MVKEEKKEESAPFNMALATLERLNELLKRIEGCAFGNAFDSNLKEGDVQLIKYNLTKQFFIQATPLLTKEQKQKTIVMFPKIKLIYAKTYDPVLQQKTGTRIMFSPFVEAQLDDLLITILEMLQEQNYFMPPKSDPRNIWRQSNG